MEALRTCFESTVLPDFERTCRTMFDHVETSFQQGMSEFTQHAQEQLLSSHSELASTHKDTDICKLACGPLKGELADAQNKPLSLAENASMSVACAILVGNQLNGGLLDQVRIHVTLQGPQCPN